jgi:biotin carboxyl carrier protein
MTRGGQHIIRLRGGGAAIDVALGPLSEGHRMCRIGDRSYDVEVLGSRPDRVVFRIDGRIVEAFVVRDGQEIAIALGGSTHRFVAARPGEGSVAAPNRRGSGRVAAPMPGRVLNVLVRVGTPVAVGEALVLLEAMKMEHTLTAEIEGTVSAIHVRPGDMVDGATLLLEIAPAEAGTN